MDYIADRVKCVDASGIRRIWQMAANMTDPVNFSIGEPDFPAPASLKRAAIEAIEQDRNTYTLTTGLPELRQAIAEQVTAQCGWKEPQVLVTGGLSGGLLLALMATINPGDEVLVPDPYFVSYRHLVNMLGGKCVYVDTYPDFQLSAARIESLVTPRTKVLLVNSPANPSGTVYAEAALREVAEVARRHGLLVFSDEIYQEFSYDGPAASIAPYYENTVILRAFSKSYGVPGWRIGYAALPAARADLFNQMATVQQYTFVCAPHPFQAAALQAFDCDISEHIAAYKHKRDLIYDGLRDAFGLNRPAGAFYAFVPVPGGDATAFVTKAIENNVLVIPGNVFSQKDTHFRISYATSDANIKKGVQRLCELAGQFG